MVNPKAGVVSAHRLREARERTNLSLRELARQLDISPSALSQIETGKAQPSLKTLYALATTLGISLDELFDRHPRGDGRARAARVRTSDRDPYSRLQTRRDRPRLEVAPGVQWERLTSERDPLVDFLYVTYAPGSASTSTGTLIRHAGREYGIVLTGAIEVTVGFQTYHCETGDSISFDSNEPHVLTNHGPADATAIWFVVGRRQGDGRDVSVGPDEVET